MGSELVGRLAGQTLLEQCGGPGRPVAESFNLLVLDEDGVASNLIVAADRAVQHL